MDAETEAKLISFVRTVAISGVDPNMCSDALDLLLEMQSGVRTIGDFRISPSQYMEITNFIHAQQKIRAIKALRQATGAGLKDSKEAIDGWMEENLPKEKDDDIPF